MTLGGLLLYDTQHDTSVAEAKARQSAVGEIVASGNSFEVIVNQWRSPLIDHGSLVGDLIGLSASGAVHKITIRWENPVLDRSGRWVTKGPGFEEIPSTATDKQYMLDVPPSKIQYSETTRLGGIVERIRSMQIGGVPPELRSLAERAIRERIGNDAGDEKFEEWARRIADSNLSVDD